MSQDRNRHFVNETGASVPEVWKSPDGQLTLIVALQGYADAGQAVGHAGELLLEELDHRTLASFNSEELLDYRSRRPPVTMEGSRIREVKNLELTLDAVKDNSGAPFLLLTGPEPDFRWDSFSTAVADLAEQYGVTRTIALYSAPMTVPHTRPMNILAHGNDAKALAANHTWGQKFVIPGAASLRLEDEMVRRDRIALGFTAQVPHYVAQSEYPEAVLGLLRAVSGSGSLDLPLGELEQEVENVRQVLDEQVGESEEIQQVVNTLEQHYDAERQRRLSLESNPLIGTNGNVPTADELGAELEQFLAGEISRTDGRFEYPVTDVELVEEVTDQEELEETPEADSTLENSSVEEPREEDRDVGKHDDGADNPPRSWRKWFRR